MVSSFKGSGLLGLSQGNRTTTNYAIGSCRMFCQSDWNAAVQCNTFLLGQGDCGSDELVSHDLPSMLDALIELASWLDHRIQGDVKKDDRDRVRLMVINTTTYHCEVMDSATRIQTRESEPM